MRKNVFTAILVGTLCSGGTVFAANEAKGLLPERVVSVSGSLDYSSKYVWRGFTLDQDPVVQPGLSLSSYGFTLSYWGSMPIGNRDYAALSNETDLTVSYSRGIGPVTVTLGHVTYDFSGVFAPTREVFAGVTSCNLPVSLAATYYNDYDLNDGSYLSFDAGKDFGLSETVTATVTGHYGMFSGYGAIENGGDYSIGLKLGLPLSGALSMTPAVFYSVPVGDLEDPSAGAQKSGLYGGFSLGYSF